MTHSNTHKFPIGQNVYYSIYLAKIVAFAGVSRFRKIPLYLIEPYADQLPRRIVKETKLLEAFI